MPDGSSAPKLGAMAPAVFPLPRPIAFFLPQYHPIPENDAFWGAGFTEWRNVVQALPRFAGHEQPHIPADLGFYDLRLQEVRIAQAEMARRAGLHGFCWYHYWFAGHRVLERPFDAVLADPAYDFPFMLCWANENWTRAWDGGANQVLLAQSYSDDETIAHARHLIPAFADTRYIRIDNRPVFAVYNADELPDANRWCDLFRETCARDGIDPYLVRVERYLDRDTRPPNRLGFDAALEFQPFSRSFRRWLNSRPDLRGRPIRRIAERLRRVAGHVTDLDRIYDMEAFVAYDLEQSAPPYPWFPGVCPSWDNSARRPAGKAIIFRSSSPELFGRWCEAKTKVNQSEGEANLLFINAWNEWAEGNHLEPCQRHGHSWLETLSCFRTGIVASDPIG